MQDVLNKLIEMGVDNPEYVVVLFANLLEEQTFRDILFSSFPKIVLTVKQPSEFIEVIQREGLLHDFEFFLSQYMGSDSRVESCFVEAMEAYKKGKPEISWAVEADINVSTEADIGKPDIKVSTEADRGKETDL